MTSEDLLRELAPQVLASLVRRYRQFDAAEEAVQEALAQATVQWQRDGLPANPRAWLTTVASRRLVDHVRSERARRDREERVAPADIDVDREVVDHDDTLALLLLCCHPSLTPPSQVALTLRAVGGLTTAEIAEAFLVPEATMAQRVSRAKQRIREAGARFELPAPDELEARLAVVLHVLYLIFNEGYTSFGRTDLSGEAIRLARQLRGQRPDDPEIAGLLALMLLTDARRSARTDGTGELVPLADQDRSTWDRARIDEGVALVTEALRRGDIGPYQLQAAIAAVHAEAPTTEATDWREIAGLYELLERVAPNPVTTLNRAVAVAMVDGPGAGLALLATVEDDPLVASHHRRFAVRGHLLELAGDADGARAAFLEAASRATSLPERRHLERRAARAAQPGS